jgi:hypothetical protein
MRELVAYMCVAATGFKAQRYIGRVSLSVSADGDVADSSSSGSLRFQYLSRPVADLDVPFYFHPQEQPGQRCAWAYVDESWCWKEHLNFRLYQRKRLYWYAREAAKDRSHHPLDPFCLAVVIALVQQARRRASGSAGPLRVSSPQVGRDQVADDFPTGLFIYAAARARRFDGSQTSHQSHSVHCPRNRRVSAEV